MHESITWIFNSARGDLHHKPVRCQNVQLGKSAVVKKWLILFLTKQFSCHQLKIQKQYITFLSLPQTNKLQYNRSLSSNQTLPCILCQEKLYNRETMDRQEIEQLNTALLYSHRPFSSRACFCLQSIQYTDTALSVVASYMPCKSNRGEQKAWTVTEILNGSLQVCFNKSDL